MNPVFLSRDAVRDVSDVVLQHKRKPIVDVGPSTANPAVWFPVDFVQIYDDPAGGFYPAYLFRYNADSDTWTAYNEVRVKEVNGVSLYHDKKYLGVRAGVSSSGHRVYLTFAGCLCEELVDPPDDGVCAATLCFTIEGITGGYTSGGDCRTVSGGECDLLNREWLLSPGDQIIPSIPTVGCVWKSDYVVPCPFTEYHPFTHNYQWILYYGGYPTSSDTPHWYLILENADIPLFRTMAVYSSDTFDELTGGVFTLVSENGMGCLEFPETINVGATCEGSTPGSGGEGGCFISDTCGSSFEVPNKISFTGEFALQPGLPDTIILEHASPCLWTYYYTSTKYWYFHYEVGAGEYGLYYVEDGAILYSYRVDEFDVVSGEWTFDMPLYESEDEEAPATLTLSPYCD